LRKAQYRTFPNPRRSARPGHREKRLRQRAAFSAAQTAAYAQTLHLRSEALEVGVEHLKIFERKDEQKEGLGYFE
jgi:hypothetical protein